MPSDVLFQRALKLMPGGVSSPARRFEPHPRFMRRGEGARLFDADGRPYVDLCLAFGPLILGHAHPDVVEAVRSRVEAGALFGTPTEEEVLLAERVVHHVPSIERVRFVNSGTEAAMHALRLARAATGRDVVVKADGGFHGSADPFLVKAGSGAETFGVPSSAGVPRHVAETTRVVPFNDADAMADALAPGDVAAVVLEPVLANIGPIPPEPGYLEAVRKHTREHGTLLVFDEVVTGFRLGLGGAQASHGVTPDLTLLGKVLGGGLPAAAFGGARGLMERLAPLGDVYQAGTYSGNPVSMVAGLATLDVLEREGFGGLDKRSEALRSGLADVARDRRAGVVQGVGSIVQLFLTGAPDARVVDAAAARGADGARYVRLFHALLDEGVYIPPSQWESCFLSLAHTDEDIDRITEAFDACLASL